MDQINTYIRFMLIKLYARIIIVIYLEKRWSVKDLIRRSGSILLEVLLPMTNFVW